MKFITFLFLTITFNLISKDNISVYINPSLNYNVHNANFSNFEGISNYTYSEYGKNTSLSPNFNIGLNYKFENKIFNFISDYSLELGLLNKSVILNRQELLGNFIKEDTFYPIYSEVPIDNSLNYLNINNIFWFDFNLPIKIGANLRINYAISNKFKQEENALGNNEYTFENNQRTREVYEGKIPNYNILNAMLGVNLKYDYKINSNYSISPNVSYNYGLLPLVSDLNWTYSNVTFGIAINYNFTEPEPTPIIPPKSPITPQLPLPEKPKEIEVSYKLYAKLDNKNLSHNDNIKMNYHHKKIEEKYSILPIIYFEENSSELLRSSGNELFELAHNSLLDNITKFLNTNDKVKITLASGKFEINEKELFEQRVNKLKNILIQNGISETRISTKLNQADKLTFRYDELKREEDKIYFLFDNKSNELVKFTYFENNLYTLTEDIIINYQVNYNLEGDIVSSIVFDNKSKLYSERKFEYKINNGYELDTAFNTITAYSNPLSIKTNPLNDTLNLNISFNKISEEVIINKIENQNKSRFILGYFNFDQDKFNSIDNEVFEIVRKAITTSKEIIIIPMTDNIGDESYNKELARKRGTAALNLLNSKQNELIKVELDTNSFFDNNHPYGRTLNRSVIIEITN